MTRERVYPIIFAALLLLLWEVTARLSGNHFLPSFLDTLAALRNNFGLIISQMGMTLLRAAIGLGIAAATMIPFGILIGRVRLLGEIFEPVVNMLRPLPPPAVAPIAMLFAGTGDAGKIAMIVFACAFPILLNTIDGVRASHPMLTNVARSLRLKRWETMWFVDLPSTLPIIMTGIRLAVSAALLVSVVSEMLLTTDGIGVYLLRSQELFRISDGLAGVLVVATVGWLVNLIVMRLDRRLLRWHYATTTDA